VSWPLLKTYNEQSYHRPRHAVRINNLRRILVSCRDKRARRRRQLIQPSSSASPPQSSPSVIRPRPYLSFARVSRTYRLFITPDRGLSATKRQLISASSQLRPRLTAPPTTTVTWVVGRRRAGRRPTVVDRPAQPGRSLLCRTTVLYRTFATAPSGQCASAKSVSSCFISNTWKQRTPRGRRKPTSTAPCSELQCTVARINSLCSSVRIECILLPPVSVRPSENGPAAGRRWCNHDYS